MTEPERMDGNGDEDSSVQTGPWRELPSEGGGSLAFAGARMAVGGAARLTVWEGDTRLAVADAPWPAPGTPRFAGERVHWGPGFLDLASGRYTTLEGALPAVWPGSGERAQVHAWSPRGDRLVAAFGSADPVHPVRVSLFDGEGGLVAVLREGSGSPPQAAWVGEHAAVVGLGDPLVFGRSGSRVAEVPLGGGTVTTLAATADERRLLAVDLNRAAAWIDTETWTVLDRWPGPWLHGAVSPDGRVVAVLEPWGKLHFACIQGDRFRPAGEAPCDPGAIAIALPPGEIATVGGGLARRAALRIDCAGGG